MSVFNNCDLIDSERTFNIAKVLSLNIVKIYVHISMSEMLTCVAGSGGVVGKLNNARLFQM